MSQQIKFIAKYISSVFYFAQNKKRQETLCQCQIFSLLNVEFMIIQLLYVVDLFHK